MSTANILLSIAAIVGALSFFLFVRLMAREPDQRAILSGSRPGNLITFLIAVLLIGPLVLGPPQLRLIAAAAIIPAIFILTWHERRWLLTHGASRSFINRYLVTSAGFGLAIAAFAGAMVLGAFAGAMILGA